MFQHQLYRENILGKKRYQKKRSSFLNNYAIWSSHGYWISSTTSRAQNLRAKYKENRGMRIWEIKNQEKNQRGTENGKNTNGSSFWTCLCRCLEFTLDLSVNLLGNSETRNRYSICFCLSAWKNEWAKLRFGHHVIFWFFSLFEISSSILSRFLRLIFFSV